MPATDESYPALVERALRLIEERGGQVAAEELARVLFGASSGTWGALLARVLGSDGRVARRADGMWCLASAPPSSGALPRPAGPSPDASWRPLGAFAERDERGGDAQASRASEAVPSSEELAFAAAEQPHVLAPEERLVGTAREGRSPTQRQDGGVAAGELVGAELAPSRELHEMVHVESGVAPDEGQNGPRRGLVGPGGARGERGGEPAVGLVVLAAGPKPWRHPIVALGAARPGANGAIVRFQTLARPPAPCRVPQYLAKLGVDAEELDHAPPLERAIDELLAFIAGAPLAGLDLALAVARLQFALRALGRPPLDNELIELAVAAGEKPDLARLARRARIPVPERLGPGALAALACRLAAEAGSAQPATRSPGITSPDALGTDWQVAGPGAASGQARPAAGTDLAREAAKVAAGAAAASRAWTAGGSTSALDATAWRRLLDARQLASLPDRPGVYLFRRGDGGLLYVGKATSLRERLASYLNGSFSLVRRMPGLIEATARLEHEVLPCELVARMREAELIASERPPYNVVRGLEPRLVRARLALEGPVVADGRRVPRLVLEVEGQPRASDAPQDASGGRYGPRDELTQARPSDGLAPGSERTAESAATLDSAIAGDRPRAEGGVEQVDALAHNTGLLPGFDTAAVVPLTAAPRVLTSAAAAQDALRHARQAWWPPRPRAGERPAAEAVAARFAEVAAAAAEQMAAAEVAPGLAASALERLVVLAPPRPIAAARPLPDDDDDDGWVRERADRGWPPRVAWDVWDDEELEDSWPELETDEDLPNEDWAAPSPYPLPEGEDRPVQIEPRSVAIVVDPRGWRAAPLAPRRSDAASASEVSREPHVAACRGVADERHGAATADPAWGRLQAAAGAVTQTERRAAEDAAAQGQRHEAATLEGGLAALTVVLAALRRGEAGVRAWAAEASP